jgi:hypothetical protein
MKFIFIFKLNKILTYEAINNGNDNGVQLITHGYNKYKYGIIFLVTLYGYFYFKHNFTKPEFEIRERPNILIPKSIYEVRRKNYIYWELSRLARGYRKTFSYYNYDKDSVSSLLVN